MKLRRSSNIKIAKGKRPNPNTITEPLDYQKWVDFVENNQDIFTWEEDTPDGIQTMKDIDKIPEDFRERVLRSLNKITCCAKFNNKKGYYDICAGFVKEYNYIDITFARVPKSEDLEIFIKMADHLDALLLVDRTKIINEETLKNIP